LDWLRHVRREPIAGRRGEDLAHRFLRRQGFTIVARNYRLSAGDAEADLIAWEGEALVFVEVKSRETSEYGPPERAIGEEKRAHLKRVAREYTRKTETPWERVRFDVVTVILSRPPRLELIRAAFR
jgi:putative endonuclease